MWMGGDDWANDDVQWAVATPTLTNVWWMDDDVAEYVAAGRPAHRLPTDQEMYERAVAEHNVQEAERIRRVMADREEVRQRTAAVAAERERLAAEQVVLRARATDRAQEFLLAHLTAKQRETFIKHGWFVVEGGRSKEQYRIHGGSAAGNIRVMKGKSKQQLGDRLCCHAPHGSIPLGDQLLAQKLMLEMAEDDFLRIANRTAA